MTNSSDDTRPPKAVRSPRSIAIVADDDEFFRMALSGLLSRQLGFERIIETGSLDEAIAALAEWPHASLALFDLKMPGMSGAASLGAVRECFPSVKAAILSASTARADILTALAAGSHGYIPKTLGASEVARAIETILAGTIYVPAFLAEIGPADGSRPAEAAPSQNPPSLTRRQRDVLQLIGDGRSNKEIARKLDLGEGTVKVHVAALLRALGVGNRAAAAAAGTRLLADELARTD